VHSKTGQAHCARLNAVFAQGGSMSVWASLANTTEIMEQRISLASIHKHAAILTFNPPWNSQERWLAKFGHRDKWNFCLKAAIMPQIRRDDDEAYPP
jgi:hypothetical protein